MVLVVMWEGMVVVEGVRVVVGIVAVGLKLIINLSSSMKSFGLSGVIGNELFPLVKVASSKHEGMIF